MRRDAILAEGRSSREAGEVGVYVAEGLVQESRGVLLAACRDVDVPGQGAGNASTGRNERAVLDRRWRAKERQGEGHVMGLTSP